MKSIFFVQQTQNTPSRYAFVQSPNFIRVLLLTNFRTSSKNGCAIASFAVGRFFPLNNSPSPYLMIILQQARQQIQRLRRAFLPILRSEENGPGLPRVIGYGAIIHYGHVQTAPVAVLPQILRAQHLADF